MNLMKTAALFSAGLFLGILVLLEVGRRLGLLRQARDPDAKTGVGAVDGAVFGMLGLLIAFTFSGASTRFDARRQLVTEEANAIGTAWLRIDLLPADAQPKLRQLFRQYLDSRLETYRKLPDLNASMAEYRRSTAIQKEIWEEAVAAIGRAETPVIAGQILEPLNEMIDITTTRLMATRMHPPNVVFGMLGVLALSASLLAGFGMAGRSRSVLHSVVFAVVLAATVYVIVDLEFPRIGLIRVDAIDEVLVDLRKSMT